MTTKRVRNHELEELSLAALRFELPSKWVIHDFRKDYGIDVQLEVFETDGFATGLRCYGQLKATDNAADDDVLSLDRDHFEYWGAHTDPVLLLRYYADERHYFWCWLHDVAWSMKPDAQSLSVTKFLKPWDKLTSPKAIQDFLRQRSRAFTERQLPPFLVAVRSGSIPSAKLVEITNALNELENLNAFQFEAESLNSAAFEVSLLPSGIVCSYLGLPGVMIEEFGEIEPSCIANTILLLIFLTACRYDRILVARPIAKCCFGLLLKAAGEKFFFPLIDSVIYAIGLKDASDLFHEERVSDMPEIGSALFSAVAYVAAQRYGESDQWISMHREELAASVTNEHRAAIAYSLGNALSNKNQWSEALSMFKLAADALPDYFNRVYFRHEYGAAFFENGLFAEAAEQYRAALALEPSQRLHYLLGDVLFCAGEFSKAIVELDVALGTPLDEGGAASAILLRELCREFVEGWRINRIEHVVAEDGGIDVLQSLSVDDPQDLPKALAPLMQKFGSDALFNFNAGHLALTNGQNILAAYRFLNCAVRQRGDSEAWALSVASAMRAQEPIFMKLAITVGHFFVKEKLLVDFFRVTDFSHASSAERERFQRKFLDIVHASPDLKSSKPLTVRLFGSDQTHVFEV
jgi:tetratricopeptide (TPR) repeat protein